MEEGGGGMPRMFLSLFDAGMTFWAIIFSMTVVYGTFEKRHVRLLASCAFTVAFVAVYGVATACGGLFSDYYFYVLSLFGAALAYMGLFLRERFINMLIFLNSSLLVMVSVKGTLSIFLALTPFYDTGSSWYWTGFELLYALGLFLCAWFYIKHPFRFPEQTSKLYYAVMILLPIIAAVSSHVSMEATIGANLQPSWLEVVFGMLNFMISIIVYYLSVVIANMYEKLLESQRVNQRLELQLDHLMRSSSMIEQIRRDKHELKNVYFYIQSLLETNSLPELRDFVSKKLVARYERMEEFHTGNELLDFLLTQKINEARLHHVHVMANILLPAGVPIDNHDLCGLMLNLLDNAIDASKKEKNGDIQISMQQKKGYLSILLKNKSSVDVLKENPHFFTTKKDAQNHGIGMSVIRAITEKYNGIFDAYMEQEYFCVHVVLQM